MKFENSIFSYDLDKDYYCFMLVNGLSKFETNKKPFRFRKTKKGFSFFGHNLTSRQQRSFESTLKYNYGIYVFETEQEAIEAYDQLLLHYAENQTTQRRESIYKNLIQASIPNLKSEEIQAIEWYKSLSDKEKEFVHFIKYKYSEI